MEIKVYVASAFSKEQKGGNKAGVVLESAGLTVLQKMQISKDLGYSETAFLTESEAADYKIEYYTPTEEVPLCGHATIATFSVLYLSGKIRKEFYTIETKSGILEIRVREDGLVLMEQNRPAFYEKLKVEELSGCIAPAYIEEKLPIQIVSTGLKDILLPIKNMEALERITPDFDAMTELSRAKDVIGVHAYTLVDDPEVTAVCRNFAPLYGIDEESATGTSNCALACYLYQYQEKKTNYIFEQGYSMGLPSRIMVNLDVKDGDITHVYVGGYGYMVEEKPSGRDVTDAQWKIAN